MNHSRRVSLAACIALALGACMLSPLDVLGAELSAQPKLQTPLVIKPMILAGKPDLTITKIALDSQCRVTVAVTNAGPGSLADAVWTVKTPSSSSVYISVNGKGWGGQTIWSFDPGRNLQKPGGSATYTSSYVVKGSASVTATVDHTAQVSEMNEGNNSASQNLNCLKIAISPGKLAPLSPPVGGGPGAGPGEEGAPAGPEETGEPYYDPGGGAMPPPTGGGSLLQGQLPPPPQDLPPPPPKQDRSVEPEELLIVSVNMAEAQQLAEQAQAMGLKIKRRSMMSGLGLVVSTFRVPKDVPLGDALTNLRQLSPQTWADVNHRYTLQGDDAKHYALRLLSWQKPDANCGKGLRVGLVDTAVEKNHPALRGRDLSSRSFLPSGIKKAPADHGTATAALLVGNSTSAGVVGLLPGAKLYVAEVFRLRDDEVETTAEWIVQALDWLVTQKSQVINLSLGGPRNLLVEAAVQAVLAKGIAVVAAAGNNGADAPPVYPAAQQGVVAVTAIDADMKPYRKANRGAYISFAAPGVDVWTAAPDKDGVYLSGTSYATPYVTAAYAVAHSAVRKGGWNAVHKQLQTSARDLGDKGKDPVYGWGLVQTNGCSKGKGSR